MLATWVINEINIMVGVSIWAYGTDSSQLRMATNGHLLELPLASVLFSQAVQVDPSSCQLLPIIQASSPMLQASPSAH